MIDAKWKIVQMHLERLNPDQLHEELENTQLIANDWNVRLQLIKDEIAKRETTAKS